jgi:hypothetical protein
LFLADIGLDVYFWLNFCWMTRIQTSVAPRVIWKDACMRPLGLNDIIQEGRLSDLVMYFDEDFFNQTFRFKKGGRIADRIRIVTDERYCRLSMSVRYM